jgi:hypothetical protein
VNALQYLEYVDIAFPAEFDAGTSPLTPFESDAFADGSYTLFVAPTLTVEEIDFGNVPAFQRILLNGERCWYIDEFDNEVNLRIRRSDLGVTFDGFGIEFEDTNWGFRVHGENLRLVRAGLLPDGILPPVRRGRGGRRGDGLPFFSMDVKGIRGGGRGRGGRRPERFAPIIEKLTGINARVQCPQVELTDSAIFLDEASRIRFRSATNAELFFGGDVQELNIRQMENSVATIVGDLTNRITVNDWLNTQIGIGIGPGPDGMYFTPDDVDYVGDSLLNRLIVNNYNADNGGWPQGVRMNALRRGGRGKPVIVGTNRLDAADIGALWTDGDFCLEIK